MMCFQKTVAGATAGFLLFLIGTLGTVSCCGGDSASCGQGVHFSISGQDLAQLDLSTCNLSWHADGKTGNITEFYYDSEEDQIHCGQQGYPEGGIDESQDDIDVEFSCNGVILFSDFVSITWEWKKDCNNPARYCHSDDFVVGTSEITLP